MIHFFPTFSKDASRSPFALELLALGVPHRLFAFQIKLRYKSKLAVLLLGMPQVAWCALCLAVRSLVLSRPRPQKVVINTDIEAIIFGVLRALMGLKHLEIVMLGFILTDRRTAWRNRLRHQYFRLVFHFVDKVLCHSMLEVTRYAALFDNGHTRFVHIPFGLHIHGRAVAARPAAHAQPYILAAGRSGRDYGTLFQAVASLPVHLHVVCDRQQALEGLVVPPNVTVLRNCYDGAYVDELKNAIFVVIPLAVDDISAGQMVLLQSMAFAKASIVTRAPTVEEYVTDGEEVLLVPRGDVAAMSQAIRRLLDDHQLKDTLAANATRSFDERFCMRAFVRNLVKHVE